ncbi:MAG: MBL fold metallo-hydrolase [Nitrospirae bacterium]|nr:MBL fold metallo-hydrolase [Nitrospirota bacterium]
MKIRNLNLNYDHPLQVEEGIFWVGYYDQTTGVQCNPYLLTDGDESVLIDGGSRLDFSIVMSKIFETGLDPRLISTLIYHHYDPDLCASLPHLEEIINNPNLVVLSHSYNNQFIRYYSGRTPLTCVESLGFSYTLKSGRKLVFARTPYSHSAGSFVTLDKKSGIVFSSDIFGSYSRDWQLFHEFDVECSTCKDSIACAYNKPICPMREIKNFHRTLMPCSSALTYAVELIHGLEPQIIAPQHGSILYKKEDIQRVVNVLSGLDNVGFEGYIKKSNNE